MKDCQPKSRDYRDGRLQCAAARLAVFLKQAKLDLESPSGSGNVTVFGYTAPDGRSSVKLPHLSRFEPFGRPQSEGFLKAVFGSAQLDIEHCATNSPFICPQISHGGPGV